METPTFHPEPIRAVRRFHDSSAVRVGSGRWLAGMMEELIRVVGGREIRAHVPAIPDDWPAELKSGLTIWRIAALEQTCGECGGRFVPMATGIERFAAGWVEHTESCSGNSDRLEAIAETQGLDISEMFSVSMGG